LGDQGVDERVISEWKVKKHDVTVLNGFIWHKIGCSGGIL